jgi:hypothetical protein
MAHWMMEFAIQHRMLKVKWKLVRVIVSHMLKDVVVMSVRMAIGI